MQGWLGFNFHYLPPWKSNKKETGRMLENAIRTEDGEPVDYTYEPEIVYVTHIRNIKALDVELKDPFLTSHKATISVFNPDGKKIQKLDNADNVPPDI